MNHPVGYSLAGIATAVTLYYAAPLFVAVISLGELCPYSPAGTNLCASSDETAGVPPHVQALSQGTLCKQAGIRYAGVSSEGATVCFTLSPDRSEWREVGYRFLVASGCPGNASGRAYFEGPERLSDPTRLAVQGFRATIRGAQASGVLKDPSICGSKTFSWRARLAQ